MDIIRYHPMKLINHRPHTIGTLIFKTEDEAIAYAKKRGLKDCEIHIEICKYDEEWLLEWGK